jgi:hypothetical protein
MLDRTRRLVSGVVDLAKDAVGPGKKVEEGRAALDPFADALDAHVGDLRLALQGAAVAPEAGVHVQVAQAARDAARPAVTEAKSEEEVGAARQQLEEGLRAAQRAWALIEGRPAPDPTAPLLEGLCAFDPRHGRAVEALPVTTKASTADVPVCRGCAVLIGKGTTPEVRRTTKGGRDTAYYSGAGWDSAEFSVLPAFGVLAGAAFLSDVFDGDGGDGDGGGWDFGDGGGGDGGGGD